MTTLLDLIDQLPHTSRTVAARAMDEDLAEAYYQQIIDQADADPTCTCEECDLCEGWECCEVHHEGEPHPEEPWSPPVREWDLHAEQQSAILYQLRVLTEQLKANGGGKPTTPKPPERPKTLIALAEELAHEELANQVAARLGIRMGE